MRTHERPTTEVTTLRAGLLLVMVGLLLAALGPSAVLAIVEALASLA